MDDRGPPGLRRPAEPDAPHRARGAADGRREAGHLPRLRPARAGTARTCSAGRTPSGASGWTRSGIAGHRWVATPWFRGRRGRRAGRQPGERARGRRRQAAGLALPPGRAQPRLAQGQELPHAVGRRRRLAARAGPAGRGDRLAAVRRPRRRGAAGLRRPRRHRVHRPGPARTCSGCSPRGRRRRSTARCRARSPATRTGSSRTWWARSPTRCGRRTAGCGTRRGAGVRDDLEPDDVVVEP